MEKDNKILHNQSLIDLAIQLSGTVESIMDFALNNEISITSNLTPGDLLVIPSDVQKDNDIANYFLNKKQVIAAALPIELVETINQIGIGYMQIENNFKVS